jgi:hypothetical protein
VLWESPEKTQSPTPARPSSDLATVRGGQTEGHSGPCVGLGWGVVGTKFGIVFGPGLDLAVTGTSGAEIRGLWDSV